MARIHKHRKGRSGSTKPFRQAVPKWQPLQGREVETQVVGLAKEGKSTAVIGAYMRDQFGVPDVRLATGKTVLEILQENKVDPRLPEEIANLLRRVVSLQSHLAENPKDLSNKRSLSLVESKIRRLAKYYVSEGRLPGDWRYSSETAKLLLE
ncbi:MAG: 30S ribosomal protein S15 [Euryarchaeota archaeon]|nr:30S ribosomal protein S15 [Euryarchaeota archaeon]